MSTNEIALTAIAVDIHASETAQERVTFRHIAALDGLRAVAILTVICYHLTFLVPDWGYFADGGYLGVDVFFVLSGFLITSVLLKEHDLSGTISLKNFFVRRFLRLAPALWVFLFVLYFFGNYILPPHQTAMIYGNYNFAYAGLYVMNIYKAMTDAMTGNLNHTWSLAIEEQFYIFWSLVMFLVFRQKGSRKAIAGGIFLLIGALVLWRAIRASTGTSANVLYYSTETRIDSLLIGCAASMIYVWRLIPDHVFRSRPFGWISFGALMTVILVFFSFTYKDMALYYGFISLFCLSIAVLILWLAARDSSPIHMVLAAPVMRWIGYISYSLYLWHYAIFEFAKKTFDSVPLQVAAGLAISIAVAAASYYLVEKPFLSLKSRFEKKTAQAV